MTTSEAVDVPTTLANGRRLSPVARRWVPVTPAILVLVAAALIMVAQGAYSLPGNDDWAFSRVALGLDDQGEFRLIGAGRMTLIGHALWGQPFLAAFGGGLAALHLANLAAAVIGVASVYDLALRTTASPRRAATAACAVAVMPGYALLSTGFMTDTTAFAFAVMSVAVGVAALERQGPSRVVLLGGACAAGVAAVSSRQTAIAALAALGVAVLWQGLATRRLRVLGVDLIMILFATSLIVMMLGWRAGLPNQDPIPVSSFSSGALVVLAIALVSLALGSAPSLWWLASGFRPLAGLAVLLTLPFAAAVVLTADRELLLGNTATRFGSPLGVLAGSKSPIFGRPVWDGLEVIALVTGAALATWAVIALSRIRRSSLASARSSTVLLVAFIVGSLATAVAPGVVGGNIFDRYLWAPAAGLLILALGHPRSPAGRPGKVALALATTATLCALGTISLLAVVESGSFASARWRAGEAAVLAGTDPRLVDAGYEWTSWHADLPSPPTRSPAVSSSVSWWSQLYAPDVPCVIVMASELDDTRYRLRHQDTYRSFPWRAQKLLVYAQVETCMSPSLAVVDGASAARWMLTDLPD